MAELKSEDGQAAGAATGAAISPSLGALFLGFAQVGLSGFGGVLPFARRMLVEDRRWLTAAEFNSLLGLCQFLPGPNVVNLSVCLGARFHGAAGALAASAGIIVPPFLIVLGLAYAYGLWGQLGIAQNMLRGIAAVGAGLLIATALKMAKNVSERRIYLPFAGLMLLAVVVLRWPLPPLLLGLLAITAPLAWWRARRKSA
ncbi:MAG TPA: chromate transporter [Rhodocyclaceae bacterium]|nr:chromate transporter [Rhodocyclaceae bacterium]